MGLLPGATRKPSPIKPGFVILSFESAESDDPRWGPAVAGWSCYTERVVGRNGIADNGEVYVTVASETSEDEEEEIRLELEEAKQGYDRVKGFTDLMRRLS